MLNKIVGLSDWNKVAIDNREMELLSFIEEIWDENNYNRIQRKVFESDKYSDLLTWKVAYIILKESWYDIE